MALTKEVGDDKLEVVGPWRHLQCRQAIVVKEDGVELSRTYHRRSHTPGDLIDGSDNLVERNLSSETDEVKALAAAVWTDAIKESWRQELLKQRLK